MPTSAATADPLATGALLLGALCVWMLQHGYLGLWHDSRLYVLQALAHLRPDLLANDLFLRFGSQDNYTLFTPLFAAVIGKIGVEPATALLTFTSQAVFLAMAWMLARKILGTHLACLALGLLVAIPGDYGAFGVFTYLEDFLTPRLAAEAFVLAALTAMLGRRPAWMWAFLAAAAAFHPLMAAGGILIALYVQRRRMQLWRTALLCAGAMAAVLLVARHMSAGANLRFDEQWWTLVRRTSYLFISDWPVSAWSRAWVPLTTLLMGRLALEPSPARTLCTACIIVAPAAIATSFVGTDLLHIVLITQLQPWRCTWIANLLAVVLLPVVMRASWKSGELGRSACLVLASMWLLRGEIYALLLVPVALAMSIAAVTGRGVAPPYRRIALAVGYVVGTLSLLWVVANIRLMSAAGLEAGAQPLLLRQVRSWTLEGSLPALAMLALFRLCRSTVWRRGLPAAILLSMSALVLFLSPAAAAQWRRRDFTPEIYNAFAAWRRLIPPGTEVFWVDGPMRTWLLLERPSYLSGMQTATTLFSRSGGVELERRAQELEALPPEDPGGRRRIDQAPSAGKSLANLCAASAVKFIVTSVDLHSASLSCAPAGLPPRYRHLQLYRCNH